MDRLATALGVKPEELIAGGGDREEVAALRDRAEELAGRLVAGADVETLKMLNPLLAKLGESRRGR